jgi:hypothetical protein
MSRSEELLAAAMADRDINGEPGVGTWQKTSEPIQASDHPGGEVMVGRSVRIPLAMVEEAQALADARNMSLSRLLREWIDEGLERARSGQQPDPVGEIRRTIASAERALRALEGGQAA